MEYHPGQVAEYYYAPWKRWLRCTIGRKPAVLDVYSIQMLPETGFCHVMSTAPTNLLRPLNPLIELAKAAE